MPLQTYVQNTNNLPYGLANTNAPGSPYAAAYNRGVTSHLSLPVDPIIFDAQPQQFLDLQYLMAFATEEVPGDEVIWHENVWSRSPITTAGAIAGVAAVPGTEVTGSFTVTANSTNYVYPSQKLIYTGDNGNQCTVFVDSVVGTTVNVHSLNGEPIEAVAVAGLNITNGMTAGGDGQTNFVQPVRTQTIRRYNFLEKIGPEVQIWNELERKKWRNLAQTNFMEVDMKNVLTQLKVSLAQRIWFGQMGESTVLDGSIAKFTQGIVPAIQANGGATLTSTMSTAWDDLFIGVNQTNFGPVDNKRVVFGTSQMLSALNMKQKAEFVRYSSGDNVFNLDFEEWRIAGQTLTLVPTNIWNDPASFPEPWSRRLVVLQESSVKLCAMRGVPMIEQQVKVSQSRNNVDPIAIYDFERYTVGGFVGTKMYNCPQNFIIDIDE